MFIMEKFKISRKLVLEKWSSKMGISMKDNGKMTNLKDLEEWFIKKTVKSTLETFKKELEKELARSFQETHSFNQYT